MICSVLLHCWFPGVHFACTAGDERVNQIFYLSRIYTHAHACTHTHTCRHRPTHIHTRTVQSVLTTFKSYTGNSMRKREWGREWERERERDRQTDRQTDGEKDERGAKREWGADTHAGTDKIFFQHTFHSKIHKPFDKLWRPIFSLSKFKDKISQICHLQTFQTSPHVMPIVGVCGKHCIQHRWKCQTQGFPRTPIIHIL